MKNYVIFNGKSTEDIALIEELPVVSRAERDIEFIEIDGRHGFLTFDKNRYKPVDYSIELKELINKHADKEGDILVVGLGNVYVTPDSLGPKVVNEIDITRHLDFNLGNAVKYILRSGHKEESSMTNKEKEIEDLQKAIWYLNDKIKMIENEN